MWTRKIPPVTIPVAPEVLPPQLQLNPTPKSPRLLNNEKLKKAGKSDGTVAGNALGGGAAGRAAANAVLLATTPDASAGALTSSGANKETGAAANADPHAPENIVLAPTLSPAGDPGDTGATTHAEEARTPNCAGRTHIGKPPTLLPPTSCARTWVEASPLRPNY